jgi:hypothetical protein
MWTANGKTATLLLFLNSVVPTTEMNASCFIWTQNSTRLQKCKDISEGEIISDYLVYNFSNAVQNIDIEKQ